MHITCKCLNVSIKTDGDVKNANLDDLSLTAAEQNDMFFTDKLKIGRLVSISKEQSSLVSVHNAGDWIIHQCINCDMYTHAIHREKGAACVLISGVMLSDPAEISSLKTSPLYSPVFRITVAGSTDEILSKTNLSDAHPSGMQTNLAALQQQLTEALQRETQTIDDRIRQFSDEQYSLLEEFRKRAHEEHKSLCRLLVDFKLKEDAINLSHTRTPSVTPGPKSSISQPLSLPPPPELLMNLSVRQQSVQQQLKENGQNIRKVPSSAIANQMHERSSPQPLTNLNRQSRSSVDCEGMFELEGMDEHPPENFPSEEESDTDESGSHDEGIHIPRPRGTPMNLAKSLPVSVPAFPGEHGHGEDIEEDPQSENSPKDIAASIKALARSVHGDAVFGDLPRPRFSSQI